MAKKTRKNAPRRAAKAAAPEMVEVVIQVISEKSFSTLIKKCEQNDKDIAAARGSKGGNIADAVERLHLHKGAFGIYQRLDKMSDTKRSELLHHLDLYRSRSNWDDQLDLFRSAAADSSVKEEESDQADIEDVKDQEPARAGKNGQQVEPQPTI